MTRIRKVRSDVRTNVPALTIGNSNIALWTIKSYDTLDNTIVGAMVGAMA